MPRTRQAPLLTAIIKFIRTYVVMTDAQTLTVALWALHTHCVQVFQQTPYLAVTSPEKQCGKSRLLEVLELLVARPWMAVLPSEAVLYRQVEAQFPTLLLDEIDTIFKPGVGDKYEGHRAILNAGHRQGLNVPRCFGPNQEVKAFRVFCPKVLAGIGSLPDTVADRSVPIRLVRRKRDEEVQRFFRRQAVPVAERLQERIEKWAEKHRDALADARPPMPDELSDRMQEGCEPLIAVADTLGAGPNARTALVELLTGERLDNQESHRLRLLGDLRLIFTDADRRSGRRVRGIGSTALVEKLNAIEEAPWSSYYRRGLDARDLANLLKHYGIKPTTIRRQRLDLRKGEKAVGKGYRRDPLEDAWQRYLPQPSNRSNRASKGTK